MNNDPCSKFTINKKPEFFNNKSIYSSADCKQNKNYRVSNFGFKKHSKNLTETSVKKGKKKYLNERYTFIRKRTLSHLINLMKTLEPYVKSDTVNSINMDGVVLPCIKSTERYRIKGLSVRSVYVEFFCMNDGYPLMEMYEEGIDKNFMWITKIIWLSCPFDSWELRPRVYINNKECIRFDV